MRGGRRSALVAVTVAGLLVGCTSTEEEPVPDDAVRLRANIPTDVAGLSVVAGNVEEDRAVLSVADGTSPATVLDARVGETVEALGVSFTLVATDVGGDDRGDLPDAVAWVVVEQD
ncbi:hypothetical protein [Cellulomonas dongxiuzhuiae]|uniref:Uncharacterized protein n=1 Tax=Cellulomonas dongxiuzhuiae TaxID=2819979 RepID=A0ABX8GHE0_9CELL|nr:hypothetical protein [Cellulomonas dongxiuzhuiae]MBO3094217.1 hypothetical protein [Cellulomonas dongxiuzhuiae]QWC15268.1 hypothetical protein KKR89_13205 [Cellulomonas dongxiuzhuiae]